MRSHAKINLGLEVLGKRGDGYHDLATVMQAVSLHDVLTIAAAGRLEVESASLGVGPEGNLVWRAAEALRQSTGCKGHARISLSKSIPIRAGLGGGSSNAACTLLGLNRFWGTDLGLPDLKALAEGLGSDVPYFLKGGTALVQGRGERVEPIEEPPSQTVVLGMPPAGLGTADVYRELRLEEHSDGTAVRRLAAALGRGRLDYTAMRNTLAGPALRLCPEIQKALDILADRGAAASMVSGSGSACFGLFPESGAARNAMESLRAEGYWSETCQFVRAWDGPEPISTTLDGPLNHS